MNIHAFSCTRGRAARCAASALGAVVLAVGAFAPVAAQAAAPKTLYVSQTGLDSGTCPSASPCATVSYALTKAASGATIKVSGTIADHITISQPVTVTTWPHGPAISPGVLDGTGSGTVVSVTTGVTGVTLHDLTIENGSQGISHPGFGPGDTLTLTDSTVSGNIGSGAIYNGSTMTIIDSTIAKNSVNGNGGSGGIYNLSTMTIIASTITGNATPVGTGVGGIASGNGGIATLAATIVAGNTGGNCYGGTASLHSAGYNLTNDKTRTACGFNAATDRVNKNPLLGHLASNGGPTKTVLPGAGGPADDVIPQGTSLHGVTACPGTDQRGVTRPAQGETRCTIGAVEI
jgi:hypothetical protein